MHNEAVCVYVCVVCWAEMAEPRTHILRVTFRMHMISKQDDCGAHVENC